MRSYLPSARACGVALLAAACAAPLHAQAVLIVEHHKKPHIVRQAVRDRPYIEIDGKRVAASGSRYALHKVDEFLPAFVSVRHLKVRTFHIELHDTGGSINHQFEFAADFESAHELENVFVALELKLEDGARSIFLHGLGRLRPGEPRSLNLAVPTGVPLGRGSYQFHLFSNGMEVLHSQQPFALRESMLDRFVTRRLKGRPDGPPAPLVGPLPEYPDALLKQKLEGTTLLRLRIRPNGAVVDPVVVRASDPAFGQAALEAMRQWRFFPRIKNGQPVEATVDMPLDFAPPGKPAKES